MREYKVIKAFHYGLLRKDFPVGTKVSIDGFTIYVDDYKVVESPGINWALSMDSAVSKKWAEVVSAGDKLVSQKQEIMSEVKDSEEEILESSTEEKLDLVEESQEKIEELVEEEFDYKEGSLDKDKWSVLPWQQKKKLLETKKWSNDNLSKALSVEKKDSKIYKIIGQMMMIIGG